MAEDTPEGGTVTPIAKARQKRANASRAPKAPPHHGDWRDQLSYTKNAEIRQTISNVALIMKNSPEWDGVIAADLFACREVFLKLPPWPPDMAPAESAWPRPFDPWTDADDTLAAVWVQRKWTGMTVSPEQMTHIVRLLARQQPVHPVRDYLDGLRWDGQRRLGTWLSTYLGVPQNEYSAAVGAWWLTSAVARVRLPGCPAQYCLVLEGPQGRKKSTAIATLAGGWFSDQMPELGSKDSYASLSGRWIIELAELDALTRAEVSRVKAFLTATTDRYRPSYGRRFVEVPRQCVFAGTVNHDEWNKDPTGARRFWPVRVGTIDIEALQRDRDQLWAEADQVFQGGGRWYPKVETEEDERLQVLIAEEQSARYENDAWEGLIATWISERVSPFSTEDIFRGALGALEKDRWSRQDQMRIANCLRRLECTKSRTMIDGRRVYQWQKKTQS